MKKMATKVIYGIPDQVLVQVELLWQDRLAIYIYVLLCDKVGGFT